LPFFTLQVKPDGAIVEALICVSDGLRDALMKEGKAVPFPIKIQALIDTGAGCTCVDPQIFKELNLTRKGTCTLATPSTGEKPCEVDEYDVSIKILGVPATPFYLGTVAVAAIAPVAYQALIGRDVLEHFLLSYNGRSKFFTLAY
jgi:predicted aspartyl protease